MSWSTFIKEGRIIEINGVRLMFDRAVKLVLLDQAHVVLPSGKIVEPKKTTDE